MTATSPQGDMCKGGYCLSDIAYEAMEQRGFLPDFSAEIVSEVAALSEGVHPKALRDMRNLLWFSIDNDDSRDLDQLTYAESGGDGTHIAYIAIADVAYLVKDNSAIEAHAAHNTTSVYTPTRVFPMLPLELSTDRTSLNQGVDRYAVVVEMAIQETGEYHFRDIYPALVHNHAKLTYNRVGAWLVGKNDPPHTTEQINGLEAQLKLQDAIAQRIKQYRYSEGALTFYTIEAKPVLDHGQPVALREAIPNRANELIENFMIAANVGMTLFMTQKGLPTIRRIVRTPSRWDRIITIAKEKGTTLPPEPDVKALQAFLIKQKSHNPTEFPDLSLAIIKCIGKGEYVVGYPGKPSPGHFDLALHDYAHTTAPNRRYPDLIMQRLLKGQFNGTANHYTPDALEAIAHHCTEKEDDATKVTRRVLKSAQAMVLADKIGASFDGIVTGAAEKGTWVRLFNPPVEGKLARGFKGVDIGDRIRVRLLHVDIAKGFIDFEKI